MTTADEAAAIPAEAKAKAQVRTPAQAQAGNRGLVAALNLLGVAVVAFYLVRESSGTLPMWLVAAGVVGLAAWVADVVVVADPRSHGRNLGTARTTASARSAALAVLALSGALLAVPTSGLGVAMVVAAVIRCLGTPIIPLWRGVVLSLVSIAVIPLGLLVAPLPLLGVLSIVAGVVIAAFAGFSRRQVRIGEIQSRALLDQQLTLREERAKAAMVAERQAVARDIHDVLAHSLGGLTIQLDAVEALLESGRVSEATTRVQDARRLAASGLAEARRAVDALREPARREQAIPSAVDGDSLVRALSELVDAHRALGGEVDLRVADEFAVTVDEFAVTVDDAAATALTRALQEALTNARRHAPGERVRIGLRVVEDALVLRVVNQKNSRGGSAIGGRNGIRGMIERVSRVPGGSVEVVDSETSFAVVVRVAVLETRSQ